MFLTDLHFFMSRESENIIYSMTSDYMCNFFYLNMKRRSYQNMREIAFLLIEEKVCRIIVIFFTLYSAQK